jgi:hypothetical protein
VLCGQRRKAQAVIARSDASGDAARFLSERSQRGLGGASVLKAGP